MAEKGSKASGGRSSGAGAGSGKGASGTAKKEAAMKSGGKRISKAPQMAADAADVSDDYYDDGDDDDDANSDLAKAITASVGLHHAAGSGGAAAPSPHPPLRLGQSIAAPPAAPKPASTSAPKSGFESVTTAEGARDLLWACESCTFHNRSLALSCEVCSAARPAEVTAVPPTFTGGYDSYSDHGSGGALGVLGPQRDLWTCAACTFSNDPDQGRCEVCNVPRNHEAAATATALLLGGAARPTSGGGNSTTAGGAGAGSGESAPSRGAKKAGKKNKADKKDAAPASTAASSTGDAAEAIEEAFVDTCAVTGAQFAAADLEKRRIAEDGGFYTKQVRDTFGIAVRCISFLFFRAFYSLVQSCFHALHMFFLS